MVKHVICWKLKESAGGKSKSENAALVTEKLLTLKDKISVIKKIEAGINAPAASKENYDVALVMDFNNFEDLQIYQKHPEHMKIVDFIGSVRDIRTCVDFEC